MTTDTQGTTERPGGVTFVVVLAYIVSIFTVLNGFFVVLDADTFGLQRVTGASKNELIWAGIVTMAVGVIGILLTGALAREAASCGSCSPSGSRSRSQRASAH